MSDDTVKRLEDLEAQLSALRNLVLCQTVALCHDDPELLEGIFDGVAVQRKSGVNQGHHRFVMRLDNLTNDLKFVMDVAA